MSSSISTFCSVFLGIRNNYYYILLYKHTISYVPSHTLAPFPPPPFPGHYELFPQVLVPRSQDIEIADTTELGSLRRPTLAQRSPLVKSPDSEDPNQDI